MMTTNVPVQPEAKIHPVLSDFKTTPQCGHFGA